MNTSQYEETDLTLKNASLEKIAGANIFPQSLRTVSPVV